MYIEGETANIIPSEPLSNYITLKNGHSFSDSSNVKVKLIYFLSRRGQLVAFSRSEYLFFKMCQPLTPHVIRNK